MTRSIVFFLTLFAWAWQARAEAGVRSQQEPSVAVTIDIVADSMNTIHAVVQAQVGSNARDLMLQLFQAQFVDRGQKFIKAIAGFAADSGKREYWSLEINGEYAKVGIAEITLREPTRIVWKKTKY